MIEYLEAKSVPGPTALAQQQAVAAPLAAGDEKPGALAHDHAHHDHAHHDHAHHDHGGKKK